MTQERCLPDRKRTMLHVVPHTAAHTNVSVPLLPARSRSVFAARHPTFRVACLHLREKKRTIINAARKMVGCLAYTTTLLGALPKAHAFVVRSAGSLSLTPSATARKSFAAVEGFPRRSWSVFTSTTISTTKRTTGSESATVRHLRGILTRHTPPSALFVSGEGETKATSAAATPAMESGGSVKHVLVPVADGSEEIESVTIIDTLVRAGASVTVASVGQERQVGGWRMQACCISCGVV